MKLVSMVSTNLDSLYFAKFAGSTSVLCIFYSIQMMAANLKSLLVPELFTLMVDT